MKIGNDCVVEIELELVDQDGEVALSTEDDGSIEYLHGGEDLPLPGLEAALEGAESGAELEVELSADQAFGPYDYDLLISVPRSDFPPDAEIVPGDLIPVEFASEEGDELGEGEFRVESISAEAIVLDGNHPLAGQALTCRVKVLSVRAATEEELSEASE